MAQCQGGELCHTVPFHGFSSFKEGGCSQAHFDMCGVSGEGLLQELASLWADGSPGWKEAGGSPRCAMCSAADTKLPGLFLCQVIPSSQYTLLASVVVVLTRAARSIFIVAEGVFEQAVSSIAH